MAQMNWVFLDDRGGRHRVGLYHGDRSGHLMIHCNMRVVQVDFSVKDTKTYSFFIEDEFCELIVERLKDGSFGYEFRVNKTIDTPRNRIRRVQVRRNNRDLWLFIGGFVLVIAAMVFGFRWYGLRQEAQRMAASSIVHQVDAGNVQEFESEGLRTISTLHLEEINGQRMGVYTFKTVDSVEIRGTFPVSDTGEAVLLNGFPLTAGDAFATYYLPSDPQVHRIEVFYPTRPTIENYIRLAVAAEQKSHPEFSAKKCVCRVLTIAQAKDWTVLTDVIYQHNTAQENPVHNQDAYLRLIRKEEIAQAVEKNCWDQ